MPLDRFVLILVAVIAAAGVTVLFGAWVMAALEFPRAGALALIPLALAAYVAVRVIGDRLKERAAEGDRYEGDER